MTKIADVQNKHDTRNLAINQVGIKDLRFPLTIQSPDKEQNTVGQFTMTVFLPAHLKGTHMSRFIALLEDMNEPFTFAYLKKLTYNMLEKLQAPAGRIQVDFPLFLQKTAPVSGIQSLMDYNVTCTGEIKDEEYYYTLKVTVPVTSLCPCSKEISAYGAHNQRSHVTVTLTTQTPILVEEIITMVETEASSQLYGLLKRPDEKFVTEHAYDNPKFVEDIVRDVAAHMYQDKRFTYFKVESENFESIHNHSAYAYIEHP